MSNCSPGVSPYRPPRHVATAVLHGSPRKRTVKDPKSRADPTRYTKHRKVADQSLDSDSVTPPLKRPSFSRTIRISSDDQQAAPSAADDWSVPNDPDASELCSSRNDDVVDDAISDEEQLIFRSTPPIAGSSTPVVVKTEPLDLHFNLTDPSDSDSDDSVCILDPKGTLNLLTKTFDTESDGDDGESEGMKELRKRRRKREEEEEKEKSSSSNSPTVVEFDLEEAVDRPVCLEDVHIRVCRPDERRVRRTFHLDGRTVTALTLESDDCSGFGFERLLLDPISPNLVDYYSSHSPIVSANRPPSVKKRKQKAKRSKPFLTAASELSPKSLMPNYEDDEDEFVSLAPMLAGGDIGSGDSPYSAQKANIDTCKRMDDVHDESSENLNESEILKKQREHEETAEEGTRRDLAARDTPDVLFEVDERRSTEPEEDGDLWLFPTIAPPDPSEVRSWMATRQAVRFRALANFDQPGGESEGEQSAGSQSLGSSGTRKPRALRTNRRVARRQGPKAVDLEKNLTPLDPPPSNPIQCSEQFNNSSEITIAEDCESTALSMDLFLEEDSATESEAVPCRTADDADATSAQRPLTVNRAAQLIDDVQNIIAMPKSDHSSQHLTSDEVQAHCADDNSLMIADSNDYNNCQNLRNSPALDYVIGFKEQQPVEDQAVVDSDAELFGFASAHALVEPRHVENEKLNLETETTLLFSDEACREKEPENIAYNLQQPLMQRPVGEPSSATGDAESDDATIGDSWRFPSAEVDSREEVMSPALSDAAPVRPESVATDRSARPPGSDSLDSFLNVSSFCSSAPCSTLPATSHSACSVAHSLPHSSLYDSEPLFDGFDNFDEFARAILPADICNQPSADISEPTVGPTGQDTAKAKDAAHSMLTDDRLTRDSSVTTLLEAIGQADDVSLRSIPVEPLETVGHSVDATCDGWLLPNRANGAHESSTILGSPSENDPFPNLVADVDVSSAAVMVAGSQPLPTSQSQAAFLNGAPVPRAARDEDSVLANLRQCDVERVLMELEESSSTAVVAVDQPNLADLADLDAHRVDDVEHPHELEGTYPYDEYQDAIASSVDFVDETGQPLTFEQLPIAAPIIHQIQVFLGNDQRKEPKGRRGRPPGSGRRRQTFDETTRAVNAIQGFDERPIPPSYRRRTSPTGQVFVLDESRRGHSDANQVVSSVIGVLKTQMKSRHQRRPVGRPPRAISDESDFERPPIAHRSSAAVFKRRQVMYSDSEDDRRRKRRGRSAERDPDWMRAQSGEESDRPPTPTHRRRRTARDDNDDHFVSNPEPDTTEVCKMLTRAIPEAFENMNEPESVSKIVSALEEGLKHFTRKLKMREGSGKQAVFRSAGDRADDGGGCEPKSTSSNAEGSALFVPNAPSSSSRAEMNPFRLHIRRPIVRSPAADAEIKPKRPRGRPRKIRPASPPAYQRPPYMSSDYLNSPSTPAQSATPAVSIGSPTAQVSSTTRIGDSPQAFDMSSSSPSFGSF